MFFWNDTCMLRQSNLDDRQLLLLSSNRIQCCLNSFEIGPELQPKQQHTPFHINLPHEIDAVYPTFDCENRYFFHGIEVIPSKDGASFSVALLLNNGDIFLQDFKRSHSTTSSTEESSDFSNYKYQNDIGKKVYINRDMDSKTLSYLKAVKEYHEKRKDVTQVWRYPKEGRIYCSECKKNKCKYSNDFCKCYSIYNLKQEKELLEHDSSDEDEEVRQRKYFNKPLQDLETAALFEDEKLDFGKIRDNWRSLAEAPDKPGVFSICGNLTAKLFDRWVPPTPECDDSAHNIPSTSSSTSA